jgi:ribosomal protein S18 acetylase RimI-like enzyme
MFQIRAATLEDAVGLARVQVDSYRNAYARFFPPSYFAQMTYEEQTGDWQELFRAGMEDILLVAEAGDKRIIGYVLASTKPEVYPGYDSEIVALHVRQEEQRKGVGAALLRAAVEQVQTRNARSVMLTTLKGNPIRAWYERLGGALLGEKTNSVDDWEIVSVIYGWPDISTLQPWR